MDQDFGDIGVTTYILSGLAYSALAVYLLIRRDTDDDGEKHGENLWLSGVAFISAIWSFATSLSFQGKGDVVLYLSLLETLRAAAWIIFFALLLSRVWRFQGNEQLGRRLITLLGIFLGGVLIMNLLDIVFLQGLVDFRLPIQYNIYSKLVICIIIFLLVENLYRNSAVEGRWGVRLLLLGVAALYIYDFLLFADTLLFTAIGETLFESRGMVNFIVVPILALSVSRNPNWTLNVKMSRKVAFHTVTLIGTGAYLIGMSAAGYFLQNYGGKWGNILQATFILAALLGLVVLITSGRFRAVTQVLLTKHFFQYRYDYREEWLKFINTISATGEHYGLRERVIKSLADIVESPGGALWLAEQPDVYQLAAKWNFPFEMEDELLPDDPLIKFLEQKEWVVDLSEEIEDGRIAQHGGPVPAWLLGNARFWLILPLIHLGKLVGFIVLLQPRVKNTLNWESTDLLKTIGRQVASYLAEQISEKALAESREFESFNRKFAFVVHDIKNLASQLSLMVKNAEKHAHNPEFQKDMVLTVQDSVAKMNNLLSRISIVQEPAREKNDQSLNLSEFMYQIVGKYKKRGMDIQYEAQEGSFDVMADEESIETIFMHLFENAREACAEDSLKLQVQLSREGGFAIVKVVDNGHGMTQEFIQNELFRPFRSTKENGYGIGAYESREMIKRLGGKLDVKSKVAVGTTMKVYLRVAAEQSGTVI